MADDLLTLGGIFAASAALCFCLNLFFKRTATSLLVYAASIGMFILVALFATYMNYVDEDGIVHEPAYSFFLIALLFLFIGVAGFIVTGLQAVARELRGARR
jgi:NADH:ubiquinone oxidoreductase subunit 6 (subunit J)